MKQVEKIAKLLPYFTALQFQYMLKVDVIRKSCRAELEEYVRQMLDEHTPVQNSMEDLPEDFITTLIDLGSVIAQTVALARGAVDEDQQDDVFRLLGVAIGHLEEDGESELTIPSGFKLPFTDTDTNLYITQI